MPPSAASVPAATAPADGTPVPAVQSTIDGSREVAEAEVAKASPSLVMMLTLIPQVCGNWEDSDGKLIVIKSGPNCTVVVTHESDGQLTLKYDEFIVDGKFRYGGHTGMLEGGSKINWSNGSVWTRDI